MIVSKNLKDIFILKFKTIALVLLISATFLAFAGCISSPYDYAGNEIPPSDSDRIRYGVPLRRSWSNIGVPPNLVILPSNGFVSPSVEPRRGIVTTNFGGLDVIHAAARQPDGKIVAAGVASNLSGTNFGLVRYNQNGTLDATFGTGGKVITDFFTGSDSRNQGIGGLVIQPDGKIVVAGTVLLGLDRNKYDIGLARYNPDGSLDASFGNGGKAVTNIANNKADVAAALALQSDGKIVTAGFNGAPFTPQVRSDFVLVRYNSNGSLDSSFGAGGLVSTDFNNDNDFAVSMLIQPDGKIIAAGCVYNLGTSSYDFAFARYDSTGGLDNGFGNGGKVILDFGSVPNDPRDDCLSGMVLLPDGKILAAGTGEPNRNATATDFVIARLNSNGTLDTTFGAGGRVSTDFNGTIDYATSIALYPDSRFVVVGVANGLIETGLVPYLSIRFNVRFTQSPTASDFAVARYLPNGALDQSFGTGGKGTTDILGSVDGATKVLILPDGNILALGFAQTTVYVPDQGQNLQTTDFASAMYPGTILQRRKLYDFDGDGRAEIAVFRPSNGTWYFLNSVSNSFRGLQFGANGDKPVAGDYDGDGFADIAVYRNGIWYVLRSSDNAFFALQFGIAEDRPVPDDFDGDGKADFVVFRPSNGSWYLLRSQAGFTGVQFGIGEDIPLTGDYDGDGKADIAVFRPSNGAWYLLQSQNGFGAVQFGTNGDRPVAADFDGDARADIAVFRPSNGAWYYLQSTNGQFVGLQFGTNGDIPAAADFDGDQLSDIAVFRPTNGAWYWLNSLNGQFNAVQFGTNGDIPIPALR